MKKRVLSAIGLIIITLSFVLLSRITRVLFFAIAGILCVYEFSRNMKKINICCADYLIYAYILIQGLLIILRAGDRAFFVCFCCFIYFVLIAGVINRKIGAQGTISTIFALIYPGFLMTAIMLVISTEYWLQILCLGCISCWVCDSFALFGGLRFGKHKVAPHISPKKSIEGCICGAISSVFCGALLYLLIPLLKHLSPVVFASADADIPLWLYMLTAFLASTMGQLGDLAESMLKRMIGVKDFSNLIPGHGGMFDRADSLLFAIPTAYFCLLLGHIL